MGPLLGRLCLPLRCSKTASGAQKTRLGPHGGAGGPPETGSETGSAAAPEPRPKVCKICKGQPHVNHATHDAIHANVNATVAFWGLSWGGSVCHFGALNRLLAHSNLSWPTWGRRGTPRNRFRNMIRCPSGRETCPPEPRNHLRGIPRNSVRAFVGQFSCSQVPFGTVLQPDQPARAPKPLAEFCGVLPEPSLACLRACISCTRTRTNMYGYGCV